jgi:PKHD-type hydroxylase
MSFIGNDREVFWCFEKALDKKTCQKIIKLGLSRKKSKAVVGKDKDSTKNLNIRNSNVTFLNENWIYDIIRKYVDIANKNAKWEFELVKSEHVQFTVYKKGHFYTWHQDCWPEPDQNNFNRKLSVIIQLSNPKDYKGGELEFFMGNPTVEFDKNIVITKDINQQGTIFVFPSYYYHRVRPVTKGTRYSLVNWIVGQKFK